MKTNETALWGIHAGKTGDADSLFLTGNCVAVGWHEVGNLSSIAADREAFKAAVARTYPNAKPGSVPTNAGQLFRFVYEMKIGDFVAYRSKQDRQIHLGRVEGDYKYKPHVNPAYPNLRKVTWLRAVPRVHFSQGALYEIGAGMSFFLIKTYAEEFRTALEGDNAAAIPAVQDDSVTAVAGNIEENTRDFVLKLLSQELKGHPFAEFVAHLLNTMGYRTRLSDEGPDGGVDIVAHTDELGFEPPIIKVQVKSTAGSTGDPVVSSLYGKVGAKEFGLVVSLGPFTAAALNFASSKSNLRLIDGDELVKLIFQHYDQFDSRYKGLLPLRRVYVPEPIEVDEK
jgi:restriction system protein